MKGSVYMLITKEVNIKINSRNFSHFINKGYNCKYGDTIVVKVEDLLKGSHVEVEVLCDYCKTNTYKIPYSKYITNMERDITNKNACNNCIKEKRNESFDYVNRRPRNYWSKKENRLFELKQYIEKYGDLKNIYSNNEGSNLINKFKTYNDNINDALKELNLIDVDEYKKRNYYSDINNLAKEIEPLINIYGRFPSFAEINNELGFSPYLLHNRKNINKIKQILNYKSDRDLVDDRGFLNRSSYEYIVAQFLIHNNVSYLREQYPFKEYNKKVNYRSDFTFFKEDNSKIHVEVWGIMPNAQEGKYQNYISKMKNKIELYNKYNINFISIYPDIFIGKYSDIQDRLQNIFQDILLIPLKQVEQNKLIPSRQMSDEQLLNEILKYSTDKITLPNFAEMKRYKADYLYQTVLKRYDSLLDFANKFGKKTKSTPQNFWTEERIFKFFDDMITEYGCILSQKKMNKYYKNLGNAVNKYGSTNLKLKYFQKLINENKEMPVKEKEWLYNIINKLNIQKTGRISEENIMKAKLIYSQIS